MDVITTTQFNHYQANVQEQINKLNIRIADLEFENGKLHETNSRMDLLIEILNPHLHPLEQRKLKPVLL